MLFESWYYQIIGLIFQSIALVAIGTALVKEKLPPGQVLSSGFIIAFIGFLSYQLPLQYGIQLPLGLITYILVLHLKAKVSMLKSAAAALLSFIILILIETGSIMIQFRVLKVTEDIFAEGTDYQRFMVALPSLLIFMLISALAYAKSAKGREN